MQFEAIRLAINKLFEFRKETVSSLTTPEAQLELARLAELLQNNAWRPDAEWLNDLPPLLCGPIVRKVLADEVTVWLALKAASMVTLTILERGPNGEKGNEVFSGSHRTFRIGEHLHVTAVTARTNDPGQSLAHNKIYYYDLVWNSGTLAAHQDDLVYGDPDPLPSFMVPPLDINDLRILHGSCRNVIGDGYDATPNLHHLLEKSFDKTTKQWTHTRPHQLFLTGDQIYADEGNDILLNLVGEAGDALLAGFNGNALAWEEELPIEEDLVKIDPANEVTVPTNGGLKNPSKLYPGLRTVRDSELCLALIDDTDNPFDLLVEGLKFTAKSGNHLFGLGEFFATYLLVWSDKVWPAIFHEPKFAQQISKLHEIFLAAEKKQRAENDDREQNVRIAEEILGKDFFKHLVKSDPDNEADFKELADWFHLSVATHPDKRKAAKDAAAQRIAKGFVNVVRALFKFTITAQGVRKVRQGLANVPTYMMFDDHEVTDDWHMTDDWRIEVYNSEIAKRVMQNALCGYAIFQAWGNTPEQFEQDDAPGKKFLDAIEHWIASRMPAGKDANAVLERVVPCTLDNEGNVVKIPLLNDDNALIGNDKVLRWDYRLSFGKYEAIVTDARTRRSFTAHKLAPAEHLSKEAIKLQAPNTQGAEFSPEFTFLVSPCNIATIPDFRKGFVGTALPLKVGLSNATKFFTGRRVQKASIFNYDPDFADSWVVAEAPFERLIARLASRILTVGNQRLPARVIVLSGDVHFSASSRLQYWAEKPFDEPEGDTKMVMAHLVSSGLKNENHFWYLLHHIGFELVDVFDNEKRLPKTEVIAGYKKKVNELTTAELEKRKELIEKTRWYPNYRVKMFAPAEEDAPSLLPYHQTDPAVQIPKPDWFYRIDHMRGKKPKPTDPNDPKLHKFGNLDGTIERFFKNQAEHFKYGRNFAPGLEVIATNSIAELTFAWEGKGKLVEALGPDTSQFAIKVETPFPRAPFQIIAGNEIIQVSKVEALGVDLRVLECTRGIAKTTKATHAADQLVRVRKLVSQTHWIAKTRNEDKLPAGIDDVECAEFTRFDISMDLEDLEFPKPVLNV